jgi:hypothetical protein
MVGEDNLSINIYQSPHQVLANVCLGVPLKKSYDSNTCKSETLIEIIALGKIDTCTPYQPESKLGIQYQSLHCSNSVTPPIPAMQEFMIQRLVRTTLILISKKNCFI